MVSPFRDAWDVLKQGQAWSSEHEQNFPPLMPMTPEQMYNPPDMQPQRQPPMDQPNNPFGLPNRVATDIDAQIQALEEQIDQLQGQLRFLRMQRDGPYGGHPEQPQ